ncbi:MAG: hypothetical protein BGN94_04925 [Rhizobiales bacterium 68-8]|nr:MAG: hypothetical protein BGN94_04925 [Rhizobiales bacterium 68-8]
MAGDDAGDDLGEGGVRVDTLGLRLFTSDAIVAPVPATAVGTAERIFPIEGDWPDRTFEHVRADLDAAVVEEATESSPAGERVCFDELLVWLTRASFSRSNDWRESMTSGFSLNVRFTALRAIVLVSLS